MKRKFEKIKFDQFKVDVANNKKLYNEYNLPIRATKASAGYDICAITKVEIEPNETKIIPTGLKVYMQENEMLMLLVRSSVGFNYNVRLCNQVGIVESDYYNNSNNDGHIFIKLHNHGNKKYIINKGDAFVQGIFVKFLTVGNEDEIKTIRTGGLGSTNRSDNNE